MYRKLLITLLLALSVLGQGLLVSCGAGSGCGWNEREITDPETGEVIGCIEEGESDL